MTNEALVWLLSLTEAGLFFVGGVLFSLFRSARAGDVLAAGEALDSGSAPTGTPASGEQLRKILEQEERRGSVTDAVIADELGLVVAGEGALSEVLAAYGAMLAGVGDKTREVLSFKSVRRVVVQDGEMTLTVQPIASADEQFALVTLSRGQPPVSARPPSER